MLPRAFLCNVDVVVVYTTLPHTLEKSARAHVKAVYQVFKLVVATFLGRVWIMGTS